MRSFDEFIAAQAQLQQAQIQHNAAVELWNAEGKAKNPSEAIKCFERAMEAYQKAIDLGELRAAQELAKLQFFVADIYAHGKIVPRDLAKASQLYSQAHKINPNYSQEVVITKLTRFCEDSRYNHDKDGKPRFNKKFITKMNNGLCSGIAALSMMGAYLEKNKPETKSEEKRVRDDLTQIRQFQDVILEWDGSSPLSKDQQAAFFTYVYLAGNYHTPKENLPVAQMELDKFLFLTEEEAPPLTKELSITLSETQASLTEKLKLLGIPDLPNRMIYIGSVDHAAGIFENRFFAPIAASRDQEYKTAAEVAKAIYEEMEYKPDNIAIISLSIFAKSTDPKRTYPPYSKLLAGCHNYHTQSDIDLKITPLIVAARWGSIESVRHYLRETDDINAKEKNGWTAFHAATFNAANVNMMRLLVAHGAEPSYPPGLKASQISNPDINEVHRKGLELMQQLLIDIKLNKASVPLQNLVVQGLASENYLAPGLLTEAHASSLTAQERERLEDKNVYRLIQYGIITPLDALAATEEKISALREEVMRTAESKNNTLDAIEVFRRTLLKHERVLNLMMRKTHTLFSSVSTGVSVYSNLKRVLDNQDLTPEEQLKNVREILHGAVKNFLSTDDAMIDHRKLKDAPTVDRVLVDLYETMHYEPIYATYKLNKMLTPEEKRVPARP